MDIDKDLLFELLFTQLNTSLNIATQAANNARELATHEQSKPETQYDTVALEASYLAHGQSQRVNEMHLAIEDWQRLRTKTFNKDSCISSGALIQLFGEDNNTYFYLLGNYSGGLKLTLENKQITIISVSSPLGKLLCGQYVGDEIKHPLGSVQYLEIENIR